MRSARPVRVRSLARLDDSAHYPNLERNASSPSSHERLWNATWSTYVCNSGRSHSSAETANRSRMHRLARPADQPQLLDICLGYHRLARLDGHLSTPPADNTLATGLTTILGTVSNVEHGIRAPRSLFGALHAVALPAEPILAGIATLLWNRRFHRSVSAAKRLTTEGFSQSLVVWRSMKRSNTGVRFTTVLRSVRSHPASRNVTAASSRAFRFTRATSSWRRVS